MKKLPGARPFVRVVVPEAKRANLSGDELALYEELRRMEKLLDKKMRERKKRQKMLDDPLMDLLPLA